MSLSMPSSRRVLAVLPQPALRQSQALAAVAWPARPGHVAQAWSALRAAALAWVAVFTAPVAQAGPWVAPSAASPAIYALGPAGASRGPSSAGSVAAPPRKDFPVRAIRLVVPFAPGGSADIIARIVADAMRQPLGQEVVVDNRSGAGGATGAQAVAQAPPDGYTIGLGTLSTLGVNPVMLAGAASDPLDDFSPISLLAHLPAVFSVSPSMRASNFAEVMRTVRARPDAFASGSPGVGSLGHLIIEAMSADLKIRLRHIPYRGMGPVLNGMIGGEVHILSDQYPSSAPHIQAGRLVPFAVAAHERLAALPQVPTFEELGFANLNSLAMTWLGLVAPAGTPPEVVARLNAAAVAAMSQPQVHQRLLELGVEPQASSPAHFRAQIEVSLHSLHSLVQARRLRTP